MLCILQKRSKIMMVLVMLGGSVFVAAEICDQEIAGLTHG